MPGLGVIKLVREKLLKGAALEIKMVHKDRLAP